MAAPVEAVQWLIPAETSSVTQSACESTKAAPVASNSCSLRASEDGDASEAETRVKMTPLRRTIARRLVARKQQRC